MPWRRFILAVARGVATSAVLSLVGFVWIVGRTRTVVEAVTDLLPPRLARQVYVPSVELASVVGFVLPAVIVALLVYALLPGPRDPSVGASGEQLPLFERPGKAPQAAVCDESVQTSEVAAEAPIV